MSFDIENSLAGSERTPVEGLAPVLAIAQAKVEAELSKEEHRRPEQNLGRVLVSKLIGNNCEPSLETRDLIFARDTYANLRSIVREGRNILGQEANSGLNLHVIVPRGNSRQDHVLSLYEFDGRVNLTFVEGPEKPGVALPERIHMYGVSTEFFHLSTTEQLVHDGFITPDRCAHKTIVPVSLADQADMFPLSQPKSELIEKRLNYFQNMASLVYEPQKLESVYFEPLYEAPSLWQE
jgi:hypothetical protein